MAEFMQMRTLALLAGFVLIGGCTVVVDDGPAPGPSVSTVEPAPQPAPPPPPPPPTTTTVPTLTGLHSQKAMRQLQLLNLNVGRMDEESSLRPNREVLRQSPAPGTVVNVGTQVNLVVSRYEPFVPLPDYRGKSLAAARADLHALNLQMGQVTKESSLERDNTVLRQSPEGGRPIRIGSS